jgi:hypothetical protein
MPKMINGRMLVHCVGKRNPREYAKMVRHIAAINVRVKTTCVADTPETPTRINKKDDPQMKATIQNDAHADVFIQFSSLCDKNKKGEQRKKMRYRHFTRRSEKDGSYWFKMDLLGA